jgi:protein SCO1
MKINRKIIFAGLLILTPAVIISKIALDEMKYTPLPVLGYVSSFRLQDSNDVIFSSDRLKGKVWIADLFFTGCQTACPEMSANMAKLSRTFEAVKDVALVSITIYPEIDSPRALRDYAEKFKGRDNWVFLTGDKEVIRGLASKSFRLVKTEGPFVWGSFLILVDRDLRIRGYYDGTKTADVRRLFKDTVYAQREQNRDLALAGISNR